MCINLLCRVFFQSQTYLKKLSRGEICGRMKSIMTFDSVVCFGGLKAFQLFYCFLHFFYWTVVLHWHHCFFLYTGPDPSIHLCTCWIVPMYNHHLDNNFLLWSLLILMIHFLTSMVVGGTSPGTELIVMYLGNVTMVGQLTRGQYTDQMELERIQKRK